MTFKGDICMLPASKLVPTVILVAATSIALVACTSGTGGGSVVSTAGSISVNSASSSLGTILTGPNGKTLYTLAGDSATTSTCTGACLTAWPPLTVASGQQPTAGAGVTGQLGTFSRSDGSVQVTYNGLPLYYWQGDKKAGDTTGQGVAGFSIALVGASSGSGTTPLPSASGSGRTY
jgi:predicted lipoprotein with Yx(FWY)xxD motif